MLHEAGVQVYGINTNGIGSHQKFQERDHFPFPLISDFYGEVVKTWGMWDPDEGKSRRGVVIVGQDRAVSYVMPHFNPGNVNALVEIFQALGLV
jgi:peroxiredoxin